MEDFDAQTPSQPESRHTKRRLILGLISLHVAALLAAAVLVVRFKNEGTKSDADKVGKSLLTLDRRDSIGWVSIRGPIYASESGRPWDRGAEQWARRIEQLAETKGVKVIVLDINSPGGSVGAVQEIYSRILRIKKEKGIPFVAVFGDVAASGGYYIAAACDKIVAHPNSLTGSIGVIFPVANMEGLFAKIGYKADPVKSGKNKDIGSPSRAMTAEERKILQDLIDDAYGQFIQAVADGRKLPLETVRPIADGRIYSGNQALKLKLVDQIGDSVDAIKLAAQLGGIPDAKPRVRRDVERLNDIFEMLDSRARISFGLGNVSLSLPEGMMAQSHGMLYLWSGH
jgi:protease-4